MKEIEVLTKLNMESADLKMLCILQDVKPYRKNYTEEDVKILKQQPTKYMTITEIAETYKVSKVRAKLIIEQRGITTKEYTKDKFVYLRSDVEAISEAFTQSKNSSKFNAGQALRKEKILSRLAKTYRRYYNREPLTPNELMTIFKITKDELEEFGINTGSSRGHSVSANIYEDILYEGYKTYNLSEFFTPFDIQKKFGWTYDDFLAFRSQIEATGKRIGRNHIGYNIDEVKEFEEAYKKFTTLKKLSSDYRVSRSFFANYKEELKKFEVSGTNLYRRAEIENYIETTLKRRKRRRSEEYRKKQAEVVNNIDDVCIKILNDSKYPLTFKYAEEFTRYTYSTTKSKEPMRVAKETARNLNTIMNLLYKELSDYTQEELVELGLSLDIHSAARVLSGFSSFILKRYECNFITSLNFTNEYQATRPYDDDEWLRFIKNITDLNKHLKNAENSKPYANMWILLLSHTFLGWRLSDFLKLPRPSIHLKNDDGKITESDAVLIANNIREQCKGLVANKTGAPLQFPEVPRPVLMAFATAVLINEMWIQDTDATNIFGLQDIRTYSSTIKECGLLANIDYFNFQSRKANKTIMTGVWKRAADMPDIPTAAFTIAAAMRSHKDDRYTYNNTTPIYIKPTAEYTSEIQEAIVKRGLFGFNSENILNIVTYGNKDALTFVERAEYAKEIGNTLPASLSDRIGRNMLQNVERQKDFITEWSPEIERNLIKALNEDCNSKTESVVCMRGKKCDNPVCENCLDCFYSMMTLQMANEVGRRTLDTLTKYKELGDSEEDMNMKIVLEEQLSKQMKLVNIIKNNSSNSLYADALKLDNIQREVKLLP